MSARVTNCNNFLAFNALFGHHVQVPGETVEVIGGRMIILFCISHNRMSVFRDDVKYDGIRLITARPSTREFLIFF